MKKPGAALFASLALALVCILAVVGRGKQEPIVGTWEAPSDNLEQYDDGTFTYANSSVSELGVLKGTWEKNENLPETIEADGKTWTVCLAHEETRKVTGDAERDNKHEYNDKYGDYYFLVSDDQATIAIGAGNVEAIADSGSLRDSRKSFMCKRVK